MATSESLFKPLARRPAATTVTVRELIQKVQAGAVRIPRFQRPLRWTREEVVRLLDSIWRGYPVGSLLLWKRPAPAETIFVGGASLEAPEAADSWWVVDGQQRTTALAASLLDLDHGGDRRWVVRFNPERQEFLAGAPPPHRVGRDVPGSVIGDLRRLGRWLRDCDLDEESLGTIEDAQQRLLDYAIPAYIVETDDEQALRGVFARLNSSGARMRADEVFQALLGAPSSDGRPSLDLDALQRICDREGFGTPPRREVLKAVLAMSGQDPSRRLEDLGATGSLDLITREDAEIALSQTITFLVERCGIPHVSLIPYPVVFFILARWFHVHPISEPATLDLLARWVWRGAVTGVHQRAAVSSMREQVRDIRENDQEGSLDRLLGRVEPRPTGSWSLGRFDSRSARSRIETLALLARGPADLHGPVRIAELVSEGRIAREVFRASDWTDLSARAKELARTAANRVLLGSAHTGLSTELRTWTWPERSERLESHLIDEQSFQHLRGNDIGAFLSRRAAAVRAAVEALVHKRAAWDEPELRPLTAYLDLEHGGEA